MIKVGSQWKIINSIFENEVCGESFEVQNYTNCAAMHVIVLMHVNNVFDYVNGFFKIYYSDFATMSWIIMLYRDKLIWNFNQRVAPDITLCPPSISMLISSSDINFAEYMLTQLLSQWAGAITAIALDSQRLYDPEFSEQRSCVLKTCSQYTRRYPCVLNIIVNL